MTEATDIAIRSAQPADAHRLTEIAHAAKRHWGYTEDLMALWREDLTLTPALIARLDVHCAVRNGEVVGLYALSRSSSVFALEHMWVEPAHMRCGIGAQLFEHAVATVRARGGSVLEIASDPNAEDFYRKMGADPAGTVPSKPEGRMLPLLRYYLEARRPGDR